MTTTALLLAAEVGAGATTMTALLLAAEVGAGAMTTTATTPSSLAAVVAKEEAEARARF